MYDMDRINALLGLTNSQTEDDALDATVEFMDEDYPDEPVNIATEIHQTTTAYGHAMSRDRRHGNDADIDRSEVERYLSWCVDRVPLTLHTGEAVNTHVANVRSDSRQVIGVVTAAFQTIQNQELIDLAVQSGMTSNSSSAMLALLLAVPEYSSSVVATALTFATAMKYRRSCYSAMAMTEA